MSPCALGIDIGGTKIAVGAVDATGAVHARRTIATDAEAGFDAGLERLIRAIDETLAEARVDAAALSGIGLGCPGPFDEASGRIENFYTLPGWEGNDIVTPLVARFDTPVRLINDADAALLGEALAGAARGARVALMLTIGTGLGGAVLIDGAILSGAANEHPEIGHVIVDPTGPECYCGGRGCLEALAAGPALARAGAEYGYTDSEAVFAAAEAGEEPARAIVARSADAMETGGLEPHPQLSCPRCCSSGAAWASGTSRSIADRCRARHRTRRAGAPSRGDQRGQGGARQRRGHGRRRRADARRPVTGARRPR